MYSNCCRDRHRVGIRPFLRSHAVQGFRTPGVSAKADPEYLFSTWWTRAQVEFVYHGLPRLTPYVFETRKIHSWFDNAIWCRIWQTSSAQAKLRTVRSKLLYIVVKYRLGVLGKLSPTNGLFAHTFKLIHAHAHAHIRVYTSCTGANFRIQQIDWWRRITHEGDVVRRVCHALAV